MEYIKVRANAKINLTLDVLNRREDGYHNIKTVMQTLKLHDKIFIKKIVSTKIKIVTNMPWLPVDSRNLVYKATSLIQKNYNVNSGVFIDINKNIPVSAGLAGGSSNCAATLLALRRLFALTISNTELYELGKELGADVPYCLMGGTVLAQGIGERLTKLPPHPSVHVLLIKPSVSISTASVYGGLDLNVMPIRTVEDTNKVLDAIREKNLANICDSFYNALEYNVEKKYPIIKNIKATMMQNKALGAMMSGSGPTVFAYFKAKNDALNAIRALKQYERNIKDVHLTGIYNKDF